MGVRAITRVETQLPPIAISSLKKCKNCLFKFQIGNELSARSTARAPIWCTPLHFPGNLHVFHFSIVNVSSKLAYLIWYEFLESLGIHELPEPFPTLQSLRSVFWNEKSFFKLPVEFKKKRNSGIQNLVKIFIFWW